jgi:Putative phage serine protease XkdF
VTGGVPGCEGLIGPFPPDYSQPHVYARDIHSGAGNCVCGAALGEESHTEAAPGVPVPDNARLSSAVLKSADEQRFVLGVAYQAGIDPRIAKGVDGGRDFFTEAELEKACWSFMLSGQQHGMFHVDGTEGAARPVENYIYRNPEPWVVSDDLVVRKGDWVLGSILDEPAWDLYKAGRVNGWSPQGIARRRRVRPAA